MMELTFRNWFETSMPKIKRVVIYDFDGTLARVPERPNKWSGKDWWGHNDSLSEPHYDGAVNQEVIDAMHQDTADPETKVLMVTGRRGVISHKVRGVLRDQGLHGRRVIAPSNTNASRRFQQNLDMGHDVTHPDEETGHHQHFSGDHITEPDYPKTEKGKPDGSTLAHKLYVINKEINPDIETVEFWEDRADHIPHFIKFSLDLLRKFGVEAGGRLNNIILHRVFEVPGAAATVQHIPIKRGMSY